MQDVIQQFLGGLDMLAAFVMLWANQCITAKAGFSTPQKRWALTRRIIYCSMATALFILGVERFTGTYESPVIESVAQIMLLAGIMLFPLLRALGLITQDVYVDGLRGDWFEIRDLTPQPNPVS